MPAKRKYRRKRRARRKRKIPRPIGSKNGFIQVRLRSTGTATLNGTNTAANQTFTLNGFNAYDKFTAIYEQYRIVHIKQTIYPMVKTFIAPMLDDASSDPHDVSTVPWIPILCYKIDRDDVTGFSSIDDALMNPRTIVKRMDKTCVIKFKPNLLGNTYGSVADNNTVIYDRWCDSEDSSDAPYYGLCKFYHAQNASSTYPLPFRIITECVVQFKGYKTDE